MIRKISDELETNLTAKRYLHTQGVAYTASALAMCHNGDLNLAYLAGLLHDNAKWIEHTKKIELCVIHNIPINENQRNNPDLLHAKLGSFLAKEKYDIQYPDVLSAIEFHTTGKPDMNLLEKIVFIADYIEPNRKPVFNMDEIRHAAFHNIDFSVLLILENTVKDLKEKNNIIDPITFDTLNFYKQKMEKDRS